MHRQKEALELLRAGAVIPATPLALDARRLFDERAQRRLIRYYLAAGAGGIATAVHTTQFAIREDRHSLFRVVVETVADEIRRYEDRAGRPVIRVCGACGETAQAVSEAGLARDLGYDAVLLSPGGLGHLSEETLLERTRAVADVLPVIGFYLQKAVGGRALSFGYWENLCGIPGVAAIKCASFNRYTTLDVVRACALSSRNDEIALYTGNDDNILCDLLTEFRFRKNGGEVAKRFAGGLLGQWSVWTHKACGLLDRVKRGDTNGMLTLGAALTDANGAIFDAANNFGGCIAGIHEVLRRQGLLEGIWCLDPAETLSPGQAEELDRIARTYPELNDDAFVREFIAEDQG